MKLAIQTILWGPNPPSIKEVLREAREVGYQGVEVFQHPGLLGTAEEFYSLLQEVDGLALVGLSGGSIVQRVEFIRDFLVVQAVEAPISRAIPFQHPPLSSVRPYAYVDEAQDVAWFAENPIEGVTLALHPHMFKSVQTANEARDLLSKHKWLKFLPDPAHLKIAGEKPAEVVEEFWNRLAGIHMKDWTAEFGRAYQFYAQGFTDLGQGDAELPSLMSFLRSKRYPGWLIVERDTSSELKATAERAFRWLQSRLVG